MYFIIPDVLAKVKTFPKKGSPNLQRKASPDAGARKRKNSDSRHAEPEYTNDQLEAVRKVKK